MAAEGAVDGGFVDEGVAAFGGQDLPLLFVVADVGVRAEGQQGNHHVQVVVRSDRVEHLSHQTLFRESSVDQDLLQLDFGLPGHPQS